MARRGGPRRRDPKRNARPVRVGKKLHSQQRRYDQYREDQGDAQRQDAGPGAQIDKRVSRLGRGKDKITRKNRTKQKGDLIAAERHQGCGETKRESETIGAALERDIETPQGRRKERIGNDHAGVLKPRGRSAAEHENNRREDRCRRMPAPAPQEAQNANPSREKMREDGRVEELHRGIWRNKRKKHHARREDQGLRIGDRRMAAEMIGIPERNLTIMQSIAKEAEHRVKMVFRIPWHDRSAIEPRGQRETVKEDEA